MLVENKKQLCSEFLDKLQLRSAIKINLKQKAEEIFNIYETWDPEEIKVLTVELNMDQALKKQIIDDLKQFIIDNIHVSQLEFES